MHKTIFQHMNIYGGMTEQQVAKKWYNGRVLPSRQILQWMLWNGWAIKQNNLYVAYTPVYEVDLEDM